MSINCPFYRSTSYRVQTPSWSFYWSSMTFLELREGLEPTKSFLHSFADCVLCRSDSPQHIKEDLYWIHFNELNSGDAPPTQYKSCFNNGGRYRAYGGRLMRPAGRLLRPARILFITNTSSVLRFLSITHRVRSATAIECWIVPEVGFEPTTVSVWRSRSGQTELHRNNLFLVPPLRAARSFSDFQSGPITGFGLRGKLDFLLISGENCKEPKIVRNKCFDFFWTI